MDVTSHDHRSVPDAPQILAPKDPTQAQALEAERVLRQDRLPGFDQQAVANAHVLVIGAGGLGCPVVQALAAAGVGSIALVDHDVIELSNLQRQPLFGAADCGRAKAEVAAHRAREIAPALTVT
ncbi:MAG: ThiF family adenylyltransferase, partial [Rothia mucilaginosa]